MLPAIYDEALADAIVAENIAKYKRQLAIIKELNKMHFFKHQNGDIVKVVSYEILNRQEIVDAIDRTKSRLNGLVRDLEQFDALASGVPIDDSPADQPPTETASVPEQPAPAVDAPVAPTPTVDNPPVPENPATPVTPTPIVLN